MKSSHPTFVSEAAAAFLVGIFASVVALSVAVAAVGPIVRAIVGEPLDFGQDYTPRGAFVQATLVRAASLAISFWLVGLLHQMVRRQSASPTWALLCANPISVGIGYLIYERLFSGVYTADYFGYLGAAILALTAPIVLVPSILLGTRIGSAHDGSPGQGSGDDFRSLNKEIKISTEVRKPKQ